ncbi:metalloenzyme domain protein [Deinococcus yavapaiensis]|uniref:Phosphoglycerate mutase n=1 Tax=Deinococcus yavapaiensis KR-236 TaxID=694435 RepID=A0A318S478_9DEIO|nr:metalloenzyme domain protein [Deinococcus yavapaiensis]PYE51858.1 phosphoglycerate mutase [Deinococcus yavapaiensis KR-236]
MALIWLALDGVGHPADAPLGSPWEADLPTLRPFVEEGQPLDATLGVPGLPQSATGQTTWLTGENAVEVMGEHFGPRPGPTLRPLLERALPARLAKAGARVELLNFFPPAYFQRSRFQHGCFPLSVLLAGRTLDPPGFPLVPPTLGLDFEAPWRPSNLLDDVRREGERVALASGEADLLILDLWFSDLLGHAGRPVPNEALDAAGRAYLGRLDAFLSGLLSKGASVVLSSDHGNFENLRVKTHTLARVPFASTRSLPACHDIVDGGRAVAALLGV